MDEKAGLKLDYEKACYNAQELKVVLMWVDTQLYILAAQYPANGSPAHYHLEQMRAYRREVIDAQVQTANQHGVVNGEDEADG